MQDEQDSLRRRRSVGEEMLTWHDYKAMSFTQCVSVYCSKHHLLYLITKYTKYLRRTYACMHASMNSYIFFNSRFYLKKERVQQSDHISDI